MKSTLNISIKRRIYVGFILLVFLFMVSGVLTNMTLKENKQLFEHRLKVIDPTLDAMDDLNMMMLESKMYTTNWVFLRSNEADKQQLGLIHDVKYALLKKRLFHYSSKWMPPACNDSLKNLSVRFEELLTIEKSIMHSLQSFADYDDPVQKLEAERKIEDEVLPRTGELTASLARIYATSLDIKISENNKFEKSTSNLQVFITVLGIVMICAAILLSIYLTNIIIRPVKSINKMINDLGKGKLSKLEHNPNNDEIGSMVRSVNNLSDALQTTAAFAHEVGTANFDMPFKPMSDDDTLGKALITMRKNLRIGKLNLEVQNKELERKNRELEQFAYVASHDLQEPLQTTISYVELLQKKHQGNLDERSEKYLNYIAHASSRMKVLITDLLEFSRLGVKKQVTDLDCNRILMDLIKEMDEKVMETGAEIRSNPLPSIRGHECEIKQLFQHLIFNAIKFRREGVAPKIQISVQNNIDNWQFTFTDNGIGIEQKNFDRIFVIFQRLHNRNKYNGSGIGLSHCKKIVELHKGKIWLESEPGHGTSFHFTISQNLSA